ncbi:SPOSA6832_02907, partial [Sporobolomyces salmonicolor]
MALKGRTGAKRAKLERVEADEDSEEEAPAPTGTPGSSEPSGALKQASTRLLDRVSRRVRRRPRTLPFHNPSSHSACRRPSKTCGNTYKATSTSKSALHTHPSLTCRSRGSLADPPCSPFRHAQAPRTARQGPLDDETTPDDSALPVASTSRSAMTPPRRLPSDSAPLHAQETPVQVKNIAFRQGAGTPATGGRSVKRTSARGSANRGSSIGGGFEGESVGPSYATLPHSKLTIDSPPPLSPTAVPHPQVADDKLYRSTDGDDPLAKRLRSIVSWAAQRTRDRIFRSEGGELDPVQRVAKEVVEGFIADVCSLRVDTSVPFQNESNAAKMKELEENYATIAHEQTLRQSLEPLYSSFFARRTQSHASSSNSALVTPVDLVSLASSFDLSRPAPTSLEEAVELGRSLLAEAEEDRVKGKKVKGKGKGKAGEEENAAAEDALERAVKKTLVEVRFRLRHLFPPQTEPALSVRRQTAHLRHLTHRLSSFSRVASAYVSNRSAETHHVLTVQAQQGLDPAPSGGDQAAAPTTAAGPGLASAPGVVGPSARPLPGSGMDPRICYARSRGRCETMRVPAIPSAKRPRGGGRQDHDGG